MSKTRRLARARRAALALAALLGVAALWPSKANAAEMDTQTGSPVVLEVGAGTKIDIAPYGIENVTALTAIQCWLRAAPEAQAGLLAATSAGPAKVDMELSACLRLCPFGAWLAFFGGAGAVADSNVREVVSPMAIAGISVGSQWTFEACTELHFERDNEDAMLWLAIMRRL